MAGTSISADVPLMSVGLDSIGAMELSTVLSGHFETELPSTLLFDHPSLQSIAGCLCDIQSTPEQMPQMFSCPKQVVQFRTSRGLCQAPQTPRRQDASAISMAIVAALHEMIGTIVAQEMPLMAAGLDSLAAGEFAYVLASQISTELPQLVLFDHPTINAVTQVVESAIADLESCAFQTELTLDVANPSVGLSPPQMRCQAALESHEETKSRPVTKFCFALPGPCR